MLVRDAMSSVVLTIGPTHTLRQAAALMSARRVGAAVVLDTDRCGIGIITERDVLNSIGAGQNPDIETAGSHTTTDVVFAAPTWTLEKAAEAMTSGGFRHLIVLNEREPVGIVSVRDIIRCWIPAQLESRCPDRLREEVGATESVRTEGRIPCGIRPLSSPACVPSAAEGLDRGLETLAEVTVGPAEVVRPRARRCRRATPSR